MRCLLLVFVWSTWTAAVSAADGVKLDQPILGTFSYDVVQLLRDGRQVAGRDTFAVDHAYFRYLFADEPSRAAFLASPSQFEVRLGGACGRMGALSGTGKTELFTVHAGRLYIFASQSCRTTFLKDPSKVLEPDVDPPLPAPLLANEAAHQRGRQLIDKAVAFLGGSKGFNFTSLRIEKRQTREWEGTNHLQVDVSEITSDGAMRTEHHWDEQIWIKRSVPGAAGIISDHDTGNRAMQPAQRRAFERSRYHGILGLLTMHEEQGFVAVAAANQPRSVHVRFAGMNHRLEIDANSGRILSHEYSSWGPDATIGINKLTFTQWRRYSGLRVPVKWTRHFNGELVGETDRTVEGYTIKVAVR